MPDTSEKAVAKQASILEDFILDPWTSLSFKRMIGDRRMAGVSYTVAGWAGQENARRLMAYKLRHMYYENAARHALPTGDAKARSDHREYGDAHLIVETVRAALLGDEQRIVVPGSEGEKKEDAAVALLEALEDWADKETLPMKMVEVERDACKLADGVYVLGWSGDKKRARLQVYDPSFYFPVLETRGEDDYPKRVHIAWEVPNDREDDTRIRVRRLTWELRRDLKTPRTLPWNDEPTSWTCYMSDGIWTLERASEATIDNFTGEAVEWQKSDDGTELRDLDIEVDFIPIVHVPNTVAIQAHFGASVLDKVSQILDDLAAADTDLQTAAALAGFPPIAVSKVRLDTEKGEDDGSGGTLKIVTYGPGTAFEVGDGGMVPLDMSAGVVALITYVNHLLERLETNARVPAGILGRIKPSEVPSGIALALSFGPLHTMIGEMRLVRREKYRLMLRFVTRFMWANDVIGGVPEKEPEITFGSYMQTDVSAVVLQVTQLLTAKAISLPTALAMLVEAGLPIEDAVDEILEIQKLDFAGANLLLDATDDPEHVRKYLQIPGPVPEPPPAPEPVVQPPQPEPAPRPAPAQG